MKYIIYVQVLKTNIRIGLSNCFISGPLVSLSVTCVVASWAISAMRRADGVALTGRTTAEHHTYTSMRWWRRRRWVATCIANRLVRHAARCAAGHNSACRIGNCLITQVSVGSGLGAVGPLPSRLADAQRRAGTRVPMCPSAWVQCAGARCARWLPTGPVHAVEYSLVDYACRRAAVHSQAVRHG